MNANSAFDAFDNASITVTRTEGERTAQGFEENGTTIVLECRCDAQESGRALQRAQQLYETGDVLVFANDVEQVRPGDSVELEMDDGRTLNGSVEEVMPIDSSILISL